MDEHHHHTEFLKTCLRYDDSAGGRELEQTITRLQREERRVRRAAWLMADLTALAAAALFYPAIILGNFPYCVPELLLVAICTLGGASLISFIAFMGLGAVYRAKLDNRRKECRLKLARILESRLRGLTNTPLEPGSGSAGNEGFNPTLVTSRDPSTHVEP